MLPLALYLGSENPVQKKSSFTQINHGGIEIGYNPRQLLAMPAKSGFEKILDVNINRIRNYEALITRNASLKNNGFENWLYNLQHDDEPFGLQWSDFVLSEEYNFTLHDEKRIAFPKAFTQAILESYSSDSYEVCGFARGHQHTAETLPHILDHNNKNKGVLQFWKPKNATRALWQNHVTTFNVTPDTEYGLYDKFKFNFDTVGILTVGNQFPENWHLEVKRLITVPELIVKKL
jgi:hypothetical protein